MAQHYRVAVIPARAGRARDKAKVEVGVQIAQRWLLAALRNRTFFSLAELNGVHGHDRAGVERLARSRRSPSGRAGPSCPTAASTSR